MSFTILNTPALHNPSSVLTLDHSKQLSIVIAPQPAISELSVGERDSCLILLLSGFLCSFNSDFGSQDEDTQVVATARGKFTSQGGVLSSPESGVSIVIPEGAIPKGVEQEIYFKVCKDNNFMPPLDSDRGIVFRCQRSLLG